MKSLGILCALLLFSITGWGGQDPIAWRLSGSIPSTSLITGGNYVITYTLTNKIPFRLVHPLRILIAASTGEFVANDACTGQLLAPNASCTVTITYTPTTSGTKTLQVSIAGYDNNVVPLPIITTTAVIPEPLIVATIVTGLPGSMNTGDQARYVFRFTNQGTAAATGVTATSSSPGFSTTCNTFKQNNTLAVGASCTVSGTFTAGNVPPSVQSVTATFDYSQGVPVSISSSTTVTTPAGITGQLTSTLPANTLINTNYQVTAQFTNHISSTISFNAAIASQSPNSSPPFTLLSNTCGTSLAGNSSCVVSYNYNSAVPLSASISFQLTGVSAGPNPVPSSPLTSSTTTTAGTGQARTFTMVNQCSFPVWFSMVGGAATGPAPNHANINCASSANCPAGTDCDPAAAGGAGLCFWHNYSPASGGFMLTNGQSRSITVPQTVGSSNLDPNIWWSGGISASLACNGSTNCNVAQCNNAGGSTACAPGVGFATPASQAEFTLQPNTVDTYDVTVINGLHIPIEMSPTGLGTPAANGYSCGSPGSNVAISGVGACNWTNATPKNASGAPTNTLYWVTTESGAQSCSDSSPSCPSGQLCGLTLGIVQQCGNFLGFMTANEACALNPGNATQFFSCNTTLPSNPYIPAASNYSDLYGCKQPNANQAPLNSCYRDYSATDSNYPADMNSCCGCANWSSFGVTLPSTTVQCPVFSFGQAGLDTWTTSVFQTLLWMKQACASDYTYPYDDKSSTFQCANGAVNTQSYTITFCPGGDSGLPAGKNDGRCLVEPC